MLTIEVHHLPPGTSKWNKIEHRLFSFISMNWRAKPLVSYQVIIDLISSTTTKTGLKVHCETRSQRIPKGRNCVRRGDGGSQHRARCFSRRMELHPQANDRPLRLSSNLRTGPKRESQQAGLRPAAAGLMLSFVSAPIE